ncbi:hypothetical protein [Anaerotignum propionicum]|uniref:hypothetical protein n=1 Tax=Anaerotignum propionicum TaxID=28446 RepID=UPI00210CEC38|nr:hypothetical protein [Anaerotignum propionicum]MCQ4936336.1 hypothetical protein [Anaerotignum propionicum]
MFTNDKMYFCKECEIEVARALYNDFINARDSGDSNQARIKFQKICSVMKKRVNDHYISPIKTFLNATCSHEHREWYGFIVMGINCILIEFYYEMIYGYDQSSDGGEVSVAYKIVLPQLDNEITEDKAKIFYKGIRCGIIHQGHTKKQTAITFEYDKIIEKNGPYYLCNPQTLFEALKKLYNSYWEIISMKAYTETESELLIKKFHLILQHVN